MSKGTIFVKKTEDFLQKNSDISRTKRALVLKVVFSETKYACVLTCQIESFYHNSKEFGQGLILPSPSQNEPLKSPPRLGVSKQQALGADGKARQQLNFIAHLARNPNANTTVFFNFSLWKKQKKPF